MTSELYDQDSLITAWKTARDTTAQLYDDLIWARRGTVLSGLCNIPAALDLIGVLNFLNSDVDPTGSYLLCCSMFFGIFGACVVATSSTKVKYLIARAEELALHDAIETRRERSMSVHPSRFQRPIRTVTKAPVYRNDVHSRYATSKD